MYKRLLLCLVLSGCASVGAGHTYLGNKTYSIRGGGNAFVGRGDVQRVMVERAYLLCAEDHLSGFKVLATKTDSETTYHAANGQVSSYAKPFGDMTVLCDGPIDPILHRQYGRGVASDDSSACACESGLVCARAESGRSLCVKP